VADVSASKGDDAADVPGYGDGTNYWDRRYRDEPEPFEWLETFADLQDVIDGSTEGDLSARVLHVGCGNSLLTECMYDFGYHSIVNIDTSAVVIQQMIKRNRTRRPDMVWEQMDAGDMTYEDGAFDLVLDKSVLDTFACSDNAMLLIATYLKEVERVLKPGGTYLCVSYGGPHTRMNFLQMPHLDMEVEALELPPRSGSHNVHYAYVCKKPTVPSGSAMDWEEIKSQLVAHTS